MSQMWLNLKRRPALPAMPALLLAAFVTLSSPEGRQAQPADPALSAAIARMDVAPADAAIDGQPPTQSATEAGDADQSDADDPPLPSGPGSLAARRFPAPALYRRAAPWPSHRPAPYRARAPPLA